MRIVAGSLGSRKFEAPKGNRTHPLSEKIRGALFNSLGDVQGLSVLDAFSGSGAVSFEAISRGAKKVVAVETDPVAQRTIIANAVNLGISKEQLEVVRANCFTWSSRNRDQLFDIVIADPPYELKRLNHRHVFKMYDNVKPGGLFIVSLPPHDEQGEHFASKITSMREIVRKNYGDAQLIFYRCEPGKAPSHASVTD